MNMLYAVIGQCLVWFQTLIDSVGGMYYILSAFAMVVVCGLIVYPIRGSGFQITGGSEFTKSVINKTKATKVKKQKELEKKYNWRRV